MGPFSNFSTSNALDGSLFVSFTRTENGSHERCNAGLDYWGGPHSRESESTRLKLCLSLTIFSDYFFLFSMFSIILACFIRPFHSCASAPYVAFID